MGKKSNIQVYAVGEDRQMIEQGAKLAGLSVSSFCKMLSLREARKILKENPEVAIT